MNRAEIQAKIEQIEKEELILVGQQEETEEKLRALGQELEDLEEDLEDLEEMENAEEVLVSPVELTPPVSDKPVEERYRQPSVNWGNIPVHPTDLVNLYRPLSEERAKHISTNAGGQQTRTTAVALAFLAAAALKANGYNGEEVATILASASVE